MTVLAGLLVYISVRGRHERATASALRHAAERGLDIPPTLHPVIDPDTCIGSLACVAACPEGDILGLAHGRAALVAASQCIGHGRCAVECPVGAISLVFGTAKRGVDLPEIDSFFETGRPGVHIVGELGGMGLIKNAIRQGLQVSTELAKRLAKTPRPARTFDVVIVGAGPAGLATAIGCKQAGLTFCIVEQEAMGGTIAQYPRQKLVMTEKVELPGYGPFGKTHISKEELLETFADVLDKLDIRVLDRVRVSGVEGEDGAFQVLTSRGPVLARKVVLALGRRGTPRKLEVPGEESAKVTYRLVDPEQYAGKRVLVVGGGDAALEAAIMLAQDSDAEVAISYRSAAFGRCRPANLEKIEKLVADGRIRALMGTEVKEITETMVALKGPNDVTIDLANDYLIVCIGGVLPTDFLKDCGVTIKRHHGEIESPRKRSKAGMAAQQRGGPAPTAPPANRWLGPTLTMLGAVLVAYLAWKGWDYYWLDTKTRRDSPLHEALKPAGLWGHGIGVVATAVMLLNFLYAVRKRTRVFGMFGQLRTWLTFHTFVGILSPIVIAFHAAFQSNNLIATTTSLSLIVVVATGLFGRYIYGFIPTANGNLLPLAEVEGRWTELKEHFDGCMSAGVAPKLMARLTEDVTSPRATRMSLIGIFVASPFIRLGMKLRVRAARSAFTRETDYLGFRATYLLLANARLQIAFYARLKHFLTVWRAFHVVLSVFLVVVMAGHIALSLYLGYGWIFF